MARQLGLLERAKLEEEYDQAKERAEKFRVLHSLGVAIASAMELEQVLTRIVEAAVFITQAEEGSLLLLDEGTEALHLRAQKGLGEKYARGFRIPIHDSIAGQVLQSNKPQRLIGAEKALKVVTGYLVNSILYVPVAIKGRVSGVLAVDNQSSNRPFTEDDENLLMVLAGYAAIALENTRCLEESERRYQALAGVHGTGEAGTDQPFEADVVGISVGDVKEEAGPQALTPQCLSAVVVPFLNGVEQLQHTLDELAGRPPREVRVLAVTQGWPVPVRLAGATEALQAIEELDIPWGWRQAEGRREMAITLAIDLLNKYRPYLPEGEKINHVTRLLPVLETLLSGTLQVSARPES
jgi:putative methionine-R-sulfoxide reductase with GAF domain